MLALLFGRYVSEDGQYSYQYFIDGQIERSPCQESDFFHQLDDMNLMPKELECVRIEVPLDYSQQASELISLALTRLPASSSTKI